MRPVCKISCVLETMLCFSCLPSGINSYANGTGSWSHCLSVLLYLRLLSLSSLSMEGTSRWYKNRILRPRIHHTTRSRCSASIHYRPPLQHGRPSPRKPTSTGILSHKCKQIIFNWSHMRDLMMGAWQREQFDASTQTDDDSDKTFADIESVITDIGIQGNKRKRSD